MKQRKQNLDQYDCLKIIYWKGWGIANSHFWGKLISCWHRKGWIQQSRTW